MPTIQDVARLAGVSRSTVSYALSGKRSISRETRERVEAAIAELGFTRNAGARALATSRTMVMGLFVQFFECEFPPAMLQYVLPISDAAREAGYDILMVTESDGAHAVERILSSGSYAIRVRLYHGETQQPAVNEQLNAILDAREEPAMIVHNDAVIAALPSVLYSRGIRVPDELSVAGLFSEDFGKLFSLPYTAVETSPNKLGRLAVQALVRRMAGSEDTGAPRVELVAPLITDRGSTR